MTEADIRTLIAGGESLTVEFKGEEREPFNDRALYESIVCLANGEGGTLLIGVEDDGRVTGARPRHGASTDPAKLQAAIFNNTEPRINTRIFLAQVDGHAVIAVQVDAYPEICSTKAGLTLRRVMAANGPQASRLLRKMVEAGKLVREGPPRRWTCYRLPSDRHEPIR